MSVRPWQRRLLPGGMVDAHSTRRTARDWVVDATMVVAAAAIGVAALLETEQDHAELTLVADIVVGVAACVALWWRRRRPPKLRP